MNGAGNNTEVHCWFPHEYRIASRGNLGFLRTVTHSAAAPYRVRRRAFSVCRYPYERVGNGFGTFERQCELDHEVLQECMQCKETGRLSEGLSTGPLRLADKDIGVNTQRSG